MFFYKIHAQQFVASGSFRFRIAEISVTIELAPKHKTNI